MQQQPTAEEQRAHETAPRSGQRRAVWNRALCLGCLAAVVFLIARDFALPHVRDVEVWFGFEVRGQWARWTAPLHWALFGLAAYGFGAGRRWVWRLAPGYLGYVALSHLIWNWTSPVGGGTAAALWQFGGFLAVGLALWRLDRSLGN